MMSHAEERPPTLNSWVVGVVMGFVAGLCGRDPEDAELDRAASQLVMGTHFYMEFHHPLLGPCRIHSLSGASQDEYTYLVKLANARTGILGVATETLNILIASVVAKYEQDYPDYARRPGM